MLCLSARPSLLGYFCLKFSFDELFWRGFGSCRWMSRLLARRLRLRRCSCRIVARLHAGGASVRRRRLAVARLHEQRRRRRLTAMQPPGARPLRFASKRTEAGFWCNALCSRSTRSWPRFKRSREGTSSASDTSRTWRRPLCDRAQWGRCRAYMRSSLIQRHSLTTWGLLRRTGQGGIPQSLSGALGQLLLSELRCRPSRGELYHRLPPLGTRPRSLRLPLSPHRHSFLRSQRAVSEKKLSGPWRSAGSGQQ